jgi:hypothetical protein
MVALLFERIALRNGKYGIPTSNKNHTIISAPEQKKVNEVNNLSVNSKHFSAEKKVFIVYTCSKSIDGNESSAGSSMSLRSVIMARVRCK